MVWLEFDFQDALRLTGKVQGECSVSYTADLNSGVCFSIVDGKHSVAMPGNHR